MATNISLNDLVDAIANAVIDAQDRVERHQVALLQNYFDDDNRPLTLTLRVPSMRDSAGLLGEDELEVPLLALVGASRLAIKELEITTKVTLGDLESLAGGGAAPPPGIPGKKTPEPSAIPERGAAVTMRGEERRSALRLDLAATPNSSQQTSAKMRIKVEAQEPSEGIARLIVELNKRIRSYPVPEDGTDEPDS